MSAKKTRKQNWQYCPWCPKLGIPEFLTNGKRNKDFGRCAKVTKFNKHVVKCEVAYRLENSASPELPSRKFLYETVLQLAETVANLEAKVTRLERVRTKRVVKALTARQCWDRRREHIQHIREFFGDGKFGFRYYFDGDYPNLPNILTAILLPAMEMRDGKLCLKGIDTTDIYCFAKQIWGKTSTDIDLYWFQEECEKMGLKLDDNEFHSENDKLEFAYSQFQDTSCRAGHSFLPTGLYPWRDIWNKMVGCYGGFKDEFYNDEGTIFDPVPPSELQPEAEI